jgi:hypothetical protein
MIRGWHTNDGVAATRPGAPLLRRLLLLLLLIPARAHAQGDDPPNVFLDCAASGCDGEHIRSELTFVRWMRDRADADVHVIVTSETTGGGGAGYHMSLRGRERFAGDSVDLRFTMPQSSTAAERRDELTIRLAQALVRYAARTRAGAEIQVAMRAPLTSAPAPARDAWRGWVFSAAFSAQLEGESRESEREYELEFSAGRVTDVWKIDLDVEGSYDLLIFELTDSTVRSVRRDFEADLLLVRAIARLWSAGLRADIGTSTFANQDLYTRLAGVLEYSFLPYADFSRRQITLQYSLGARHFDYAAPTIYDRTSELRADHELALNVNFQQPWGSANAEFSGAHYLHDLRRYNLSSWVNLNVRLLRGFSLAVSGSYERVRDQIYIPKGDASDEEVLLRRRALETGYRYATSVGVRYTFGSIYSTVVNPRIGY